MTGSMATADGRRYVDGHAGAPLRRTGKPAGAQPMTLFNGIARRLAPLGAARTSGGRSTACCSTKTGANLATVQTFTTSSCTSSSRTEGRRTAASTCAAATSCRSTTAPAKNHRHIISAGIYGFLAPNENAAQPAGEWQAIDVTLVGRMVT